MQSRWQFSSESREAGLCLALHPAPLATQLVFGGESFARTVRHEHRRLGAMPRLATGTAHGVDGRRSTTTRERRRLLFNRCLRRSTTAVRRLRSERRLERGGERLRVGQRKGLGMISCVERTSLHFCSDAAAARVANARMQPSGASHRLCEAYCQRLAGRSFPDAHVAFHDVFFRGEPSARCGR